jgi:CRP-like cAMP-binding protein
MKSRNALIRKLSIFARFSTAETECLTQLQSVRERIGASTDLVHEGQTGHRAFVLQEGWAFSYKLLPDGGRQIVDFKLPGDFIGLRSILLRTSDHSFAALTDCVVSPISVKRAISVFNDSPRVGAAILWSVARDEAVAVEHLVGIGRRDATERIAHFFLELADRLRLVGLASETVFEFPINQYLLSDALGLTAIHTNRVLRQLRERGLVTVLQHRVVIHDLNGLVKLAGYDAGYLDQAQPLTDI